MTEKQLGEGRVYFIFQLTVPCGEKPDGNLGGETEAEIGSMLLTGLLSYLSCTA